MRRLVAAAVAVYVLVGLVVASHPGPERYVETPGRAKSYMYSGFGDGGECEITDPAGAPPGDPFAHWDEAERQQFCDPDTYHNGSRTGDYRGARESYVTDP